MSKHKVVLLLGSNLGDKDNNINKTLKLLENYKCKITKYSKILTTKPIGFGSKNNFRNIAVLIETELSPIELLNTVKSIEKSMGRKKDSSIKNKYEDRIIDIDIVIFGSLLYKSKRLEIPHERNLYDRAFSKELIKELGYL